MQAGVMNVGQLVNMDELQRVQKDFAKVSGTAIICLNPGKEHLTNVSGPKDMLEECRELFSCEEAAEALARVEDGSIEEIAVEKIPSTDKMLGAISVRIHGKGVIYWVVIGRDDNEKFYQALDFLRDSSQILFRNKLGLETARREVQKVQDAEEETMRTLNTALATTEIVQLLDSDESMEAILTKALEVMCKHLAVSEGHVVKHIESRNITTPMVSWLEDGQVLPEEGDTRFPGSEIWKTEKALVISSENIKNHRLQDEFDALGVSATVIYPILKQDNGTMTYLFLCERSKLHSWSIPEVKFIVDAVKILQSIFTKRIQKSSLASSYEALQSVLDHVGTAVYVKDVKTGKVLFTNNYLKYTFAKELKEGTLEALIRQGVPVGKGKSTYEIQYSEKERWYDLIKTEIVWVDGRDAILYSLYDITDKKIYQKKIEQQANTDFLTGLYNRMCCERDLSIHIEMAKIRNKRGALLYLDLDDFKHINDGLGHQYGDVLLKSISSSLRAIEGISHTCYRMGGDEFVIIISPDVFDDYDSIITRIKDIFSKPWYLKDADYYCTTSMGIVTFPDSGDSVPDLIKKADIAMYEAKRSGKNRSAMYSESLNSSSGRRLDMEKNMRDASSGGYREFEVYYQPIIRMRGDGVSCAGAEALIRWNSNKLGFISPAEFIPLAEYLGLINPIGNYILREACEACRRWNDNGYPDYKVNVNLSVVQLLQPDIVEVVRNTVEETGIIPQNLTLEVTESLAINDMERMKGILDRIKKIGVKIALDDFGTGYSSLNHIREIPFDLIKVDQSFIRELAEDAYSQSFIKMVAELAETIGVSICVEGVETEEQFRILQTMKVKYLQGFYYDRPMQRQNFEEKYVWGLAKADENV